MHGVRTRDHLCRLSATTWSSCGLVHVYVWTFPVVYSYTYHVFLLVRGILRSEVALLHSVSLGVTLIIVFEWLNAETIKLGLG